MMFDKVKELLDEALAKHSVPCSDIAVVYNGEVVYRYMNGTSDDEKKITICGKELYFLYSTTKPITCTAVLKLVEAGKLRLEDKVSDYIPEFGQMMVKTAGGLKPAEKPMTIKNLFTMTSGLNYDLNSPSLQKLRQEHPDASTLETVRAMAEEPLEFEPGDHYLYSLSHDVLAAVAEVVTGMSFGDYLKQEIFEVCGMTRTGFYDNAAAKDMVCSQYLYDAEKREANVMPKANPYILTSAYHSGGAGLISCVDDYIRFVIEMTNGNRILKKGTIDLMRSDHLGQQAYEDFKLRKPGYTYGLGVRTDAYGRFAHKGEFGWDGAAGAYVMLDPDHHIGIFYATHVRGYGDYLYRELHPALRDAVYEAIIG